MDDLISRQDAIDALEEPRKVPDSWTDEFAIGERAKWEKDVKALNSLPSAERRGRWIEEYSANHFQAKCSACGESTLYGITYDLEGNAYYMNYCPNCGARMDGEEK